MQNREYRKGREYARTHMHTYPRYQVSSRSHLLMKLTNHLLQNLHGANEHITTQTLPLTSNTLTQCADVLLSG